MENTGYLIAAFLLTWGTLAGYGLGLILRRKRLRRRIRTAEYSANGLSDAKH